MRLSATEEYGLRCLLQLSLHRGAEPLGIAQIAAAEGLSPEHAAKIMRALRLGGLVVSTRGMRGGYHLARAAEEIDLWSALRALDTPMFTEDFCSTYPGVNADCVHSTNCSVRALWSSLSQVLRRILERVTLRDLERKEFDMTVFLEQAGEALTR